MDIKQINFHAERWLQFYAEPLNSIAAILGMDTEDRYLEIAWDLLLQNSAHDTIGGCSLDEIHTDAANRYKQCLEISKGVFSRSCRYIAKKLDLSAFAKHSIFLTVLNPATHARQEILEAMIDIPSQSDQGSPELRTLDGLTLPIQILHREEIEPVLEQMTNRPLFLKMVRYHCAFDTSIIPPFGIKTLQVLPAPSRAKDEMLLARRENDQLILENTFLSVVVNQNGTLSVLNKQNGQKFNNLAYFYDQGEAGNAWIHQALPPEFTTLKANPKKQLLINGPLLAIIRISHQFKLPADLKARKASKNTKKFTIELDVSIKKDSRRLDFEIRLVNTIESHRLRLMFPLHLKASHSFAEGQFDVVARPTERIKSDDWIEQPMPDYPLHHFVDLSNQHHGAAVFVDGLKEYEVIDDPQQTLAITLLRTFEYKIQPSSLQDFSHKKGSQCPGKHRFRLAFYPHDGNWQTGQVYQQALNYNLPLRTFQSGRSAGKLKTEQSFISIKSDHLIFSALKPAENGKGWVVRIYNPTDNNHDSLIETGFKLSEVNRVTLEEQPIEKVNLVNEQQFQVSIPAKKIYTYIIFIA